MITKMSALVVATTIAIPSYAATISVEKLKNNTGDICVSIFDSKEFFPDQADGALFVDCIAIGSPIEIDLDVGKKYAIAIFHDQNTNGELDKVGAIGIPSEGYGFSNNPGFRPGVPPFDKVAIELTSLDQNISINLNYLL